MEKAKEIAMAHAGVSAGSVSFVKAKLDTEDGVKVYDIEFYSGTYTGCSFRYLGRQS